MQNEKSYLWVNDIQDFKLAKLSLFLLSESHHRLSIYVLYMKNTTAQKISTVTLPKSPTLKNPLL